MKTSVSNKRPILAAAVVVAALAAAALWFSVPSGSAPDETLLIRRTEASIVLGWGWLHTQDMRIVALEKKGDKYAVTFSYSVVIDRDEAALPQEEQERFRRFLPMCSHLPIARGMSCPLREEMIFVHTKEYGWMPELFVSYRPEMLQAIADWKQPTMP